MKNLAINYEREALVTRRLVEEREPEIEFFDFGYVSFFNDDFEKELSREKEYYDCYQPY